MGSSAKSATVFPAVAVAATWAAISILLVLFGVHVWPAGASDSQFLIPPAVEYRSSGELLHPFYHKAKVFDPAGEGRLVYHGFLLQLTVGSFAPAPGYASSHLVIMMILAVALGFFALAVVRVMRRFEGVSALYKAPLGVLATAGLTTALLGLHGRPEPLAMLLVSAAFCAMTWTGVRRYWIPAGIGLGLLVVTSPAPAALGFVLFALYIHARLGQRAALASVLSAGCLAALLAFLIAHLWYPYPIGDWIEGMRRAWAATYNVPEKTLHYWFTHPRNSFYGLLYLMALVLRLYALRLRKQRVRSKVGFLICAAALAALVVRFSLYVPRLNYNLLAFAPLVYLAVIFISLEISQITQSYRITKRLRPALHFFVLLVFLPTTFGFARSLIMFPKHLTDGLSYAEAKIRLDEIRKTASGPVLITPALYGLVENHDGISVMDMPHHPVPKTYEVVVFAQVGLGRQAPLDIDGYRLVEDKFGRNAPQVLGVKIANSSHGYEYAVYRRDE